VDSQTRGVMARLIGRHRWAGVTLVVVLACLVGWTLPHLAQAEPFTITQMTNTIGGADRVRDLFPASSVNAAGTRIAFQFDRDLTPGSPGNGDGNYEIFLASSVAGPTPTIPTLSEWGMILLGLPLAGGMATALRRRPARWDRPQGPTLY
jgi:hypothetical protein